MLPPLGAPDPQPRALYVGDVRGSRGLWSMLDAIEQAPAWHLDVVGPVAGGDADELAARLRRSGLDDRVRFHGRLPPRQAWAVAEGAWCGLALLEDTPAFRAATPSKLYEYLGCGLAVVVTDLPRQAELVRDSGGGQVVPPGPLAGSATAAVLNDWVQDPATLADRRTAAGRWRSQALQDNPYADLARRVAALGEARAGADPAAGPPAHRP
nr:glycosyltransferase [Pedococcus badiiscoriae]